MNTAAYVDEQIKKLKDGGIPLSEAAWQAALLCVGWPYIFGDRGEYCTPAKRQAVYNKTGTESLIKKCQVLNGAKTSCDGCKWFPKGCKVRSFDCRGFTYWILLQIFGWKLEGGGATSQWNTESNWKAKGKVSDGVPENTLVCLFYRKKDDPKKMAHTGFGYKGETCECSNGVQHFLKRDKKWEYWAVPACVDGDVKPVPPAEDEGQLCPTIRRGSTGEFVMVCQEILVDLGYELGPSGVDGKFGAKTEAAVKTFQQRHGLAADGIVGPKTWKQLLLYEGDEPETYTVTIRGLTKEQANEICREWSGATMKKE